MHSTGIASRGIQFRDNNIEETSRENIPHPERESHIDPTILIFYFCLFTFDF